MNDQSEAPELFARASETVTCINGHTICDIARDLVDGEPHDPKNFANWRQPEPDRKTHITAIRCSECRGVWIRAGMSPAGGIAYQLHFENGWR